MAKIQRKTVSGTGNSTVDVTGYGFAKVQIDGGIITLGLPTYYKEFGDGDRVLIPNGTTSITVTAFPTKSWKLNLQNTVPAINQTELQISQNGDGKFVISGDESVVFSGQDVDPATVDITKIQISLESLSQLFMTALHSKTVNDAAKYIKMKDAFLAKFSA